MIIKDIRLTHTKTTTTLSARCKIRKLGWDTIYFGVDADKQTYLSNDASPFAAALLLPSMKQGEDLIIKGTISKQLYAGMQDIMKEVLEWNIGYKPIQVKVDKLVADKYQPTRTAMFFSAGVDSFYTFLKHRHDQDKSHRVDTFVLVKGFNSDIDSRNEDLWEQNLNSIKAVAEEESLELIIVDSNIHDLVNPILPWGYSHGGCLAAVGLCLRAAYRRIYIASTFSEEEQIPWGSHLRLDKLWSTETTSFIHDGAEVSRIYKVINQVGKSPLALKYVRVCYMNVKGAYNCGSCSKCLRTMVSLYIAGSLDKAETFPRQLNLDEVAAAPASKAENQLIFPNEELHLAILKERNMAPDLQAAIQTSINNAIAAEYSRHGKHQATVAKLKQQIVYLDHAYNRGRAYAIVSARPGKKYS